MAALNVLFSEYLDEDEQARIKAALNRVAVGDGPGRWQAPDRIEVKSKLTGGRTGALVLRIEVVRDNYRRTQIAKVGVNVATEWAAYQRIIKNAPSALCPPIEAVSAGVLDQNLRLGEDEAVVYSDVQEFGGAEPVELERVIRAAVAGGETQVRTARELIGALLKLANLVFYRDNRVADLGSWEALNPLLGADLELTAARATRDRGTTSARPGSDDVRQLLPDQVLRMALALEGAGEPGGTRSLAPGTEVMLRGFWPAREFGPRFAGRDNVTVKVEEAMLPPDRPGGQSFTLRGRVASWRSALTWQRVSQALPELAVAEGGTELDGVPIAHPFGVLRRALMDQQAGLVTSSVHGDFNPSNVLVAGDRPFLIDYASPRKDRPIQSDLAWLELNLLRHPFSELLSAAELVRLERLLALGDRVAALLGPFDRSQVDDALLAGLGDRSGDQYRKLAGPLSVLSVIRGHARTIYPEEKPGVRPWWREYHTQVLFAAHHVFKWKDELQTQGTWRAQVAAASVATEQLADEDGPWRLWQEADLDAPAAAVAPLIPATPAGLALLASLVGGINLTTAPSAPVLGAELRRITAGAVKAMAADRPWPGGVRDLYIDLPAVDLGPIRGAASDDDAAEFPLAAGRPSPLAESAVELALRARRVIVLGGTGSGKTSLLEELERRWLRPSGYLTRWPAETEVPHLPVRVRAAELQRSLRHGGDAVWEFLDQTLRGAGPVRPLLAVGVIHLLVDDFDWLAAADLPSVTGWLTQVRQRFPRALLTICCRGTHAPAELAGWRAIALHEPDPACIGQYLARHPSPGAAAIADRVLGRSPDQALAELARNPLLLSMLAQVQDAGQARTAGDLLDRYVAAVPPGSWIDHAERLAVRQLNGDHGEERADEGLACLGIVVRDGGACHFTVRVYQDYFAARVLRATAGADPRGLVLLLLRFAWRDAFKMFASFSTTTPDLLGDLVRTVADADPRYAAALLLSADGPPASLAGWFVQAQERTLKDSRASRLARERAALALADLGTCAELGYSGGRRPAYAGLLAVIADSGADPVWREFCLTALADACRAARPGQPRSLLAGSLIRQAASLITGSGVPASVRAAATRIIGDLKLHGIVALIAEQVGGETPWPVRHEAWLALRSLGERLPGRLAGAYRRAAAVRLTEVEGELPAAISAAQARQLQEERYELLRGLSGPDRLSELLKRRFAFEIGDGPVRELIDAAVAAERGRDEGGEAAWRAILFGSDLPAERLLTVIAGPDPLAAAAAAHRLLGGRPDLAPGAFAAAAAWAGQRADLVLIAAALARQRSVDLAEVTRYFRALLPAFAGPGRPDRPGLDCLGALVGAISSRDLASGVREAWRAHRFLAGHDVAERLRWPWPVVMSRFGQPRGELAAMLKSADETDVRCAIDALASAAFLLTGDAGPGYEAGADAGDRLLAQYAAGQQCELPTFLAAAAALALPGALRVIAARHGGLGAALAGLEARTGLIVALPGYGLTEIAPAAEALAAIGYLARLLSPGDELARAARRLLGETDQTGVHPSVPIGRLTGLAYLGDWRPAAEALGSGSADARLARVARNATMLWAADETEPARTAARIAGWLADRLAEPDLSLEVICEYEELKYLAEQRAGALVRGYLTGENPGSAGR